MVLSTAGRYQLSLYWLQNQQMKVDRSTATIANQKSLLDISDDPLSASSLVSVEKTISRLGQFASSRDTLKLQLNLQDQALGQIHNVIQSARDLAVRGKNGTLSPEDRESLGAQLHKCVDQLKDTLKSQDNNGHFLFGGINGNDPFTDPDASRQSYQIGESTSVLGTANLNEILPPQQNFLAYLSDLADQLQNNKIVPEDALSHFDQAIEQVDQVQVAGGTQLNEIDQLDNQGNDQTLQLITQKEQLEGSGTADISQAIVQNNIDQIGLQIVMKTIGQMQQLSMFDLLK